MIKLMILVFLMRWMKLNVLLRLLAYPVATIKYGSNNCDVAYEEIVNFIRKFNGNLNNIISYINHRIF